MDWPSNSWEENCIGLQTHSSTCQWVTQVTEKYISKINLCKLKKMQPVYKLVFLLFLNWQDLQIGGWTSPDLKSFYCLRTIINVDFGHICFLLDSENIKEGYKNNVTTRYRYIYIYLSKISTTKILFYRLLSCLKNWKANDENLKNRIFTFIMFFPFLNVSILLNIFFYSWCSLFFIVLSFVAFKDQIIFISPAW